MGKLLLAVVGLTCVPALAGSPYIEEVERKLAALGFEAGVVDGEFDGALTTAILNFQAAQGLPADGRLTRDTHQAIMQAAPRAPAPVSGPPDDPAPPLPAPPAALEPRP